MKLFLLLTAILLACTLRPAAAQTPNTQTLQMPLLAPVPAPSRLQLAPKERQFFALGVTLARGAFAYAELAKGATEVSKISSQMAQIGPLGDLEPVAQRNRKDAGDALALAVRLMKTLNAPPSALMPVQKAAGRLAKGLATSRDARPLKLFNARAARTLSSLNEFDALSSLPEDPALRRWLAGSAVSRSAAVWYDEGTLTGLTQIAAREQMPELLPPTEQLATDLRGLRDWLALRLPDTPTPEQAALRQSLDAFLQGSTAGHKPGVKSPAPLSLAQLAALGDISRQLQAQVLGPNGAAQEAAASNRAGGVFEA